MGPVLNIPQIYKIGVMDTQYASQCCPWTNNSANINLLFYNIKVVLSRVTLSSVMKSVSRLASMAARAWVGVRADSCACITSAVNNVVGLGERGAKTLKKVVGEVLVCLNSHKLRKFSCITDGMFTAIAAKTKYDFKGDVETTSDCSDI